MSYKAGAAVAAAHFCIDLRSAFLDQQFFAIFFEISIGEKRTV